MLQENQFFESTENTLNRIYRFFSLKKISREFLEAGIIAGWHDGVYLRPGIRNLES